MTKFHALAILCLVAGMEAFAPMTGPSFVSRQMTTTKVVTAARIRPAGTALQVDLLGRFARVAKSNINNILKKLEDPEKILNQALEDMQSDLVKIRQSYAEVTATQRRLLNQKEQSDVQANEWYSRAQLALQKGNEGLAREALTRRQAAIDNSKNLQEQIDAQAGAMDKLYNGMQALESKIIESKAKKEQMIARARTAQSTQKVNDMLGGITGKTSMDAFTRMEEKVNALEAAAEVSSEMGMADGSGDLPNSVGASLESQFQALEGESAVELELARLKQVGGKITPVPSKSSIVDAELDDEMERLKREAGL
mmetsp:Transcript_8446/g.19581  ORF Transcript_8446/g.19581 Transcript_8446/m.19581 type:complete len:311 (+) Transcript_8446:81-1013(+)|eukprot:CAMPEP_0116843168 /NCGR_PEP_ID=MMETSP0418-20121206/11934_1 /TAXON_ID=1158023 /ORGANISM="Astrosyne radiata, Strain 13vi08-1A" /LENGTH=310 /DNA_ID=CAMNT_0004473883 /DNA_START=64 /DNA_END=996 /DNA_ORIENTATION=-